MVNFPFKSLVSFLQIRSIGTKSSKLVEPSLKSVAKAESIAKPKTQKIKEEFLTGKTDSAISLFRKYQFSDTQIALLAKRSPGILRCRVESNLEPKLKFLNENGFEESSLIELVVKNPIILRRSLSDHLIPNTEYLRELIRNDHSAFLLVVKRASWLLSSNLRKVLQPNIDLLLVEGVQMSSVLKLFTAHPRTCLCHVDRMRYAIETVKKFGVKPTENMYIHALRVVLSFNEPNFKKKVEFLKSLGWSDEDIMSTMARQPLCLSQSEDKLRSTFEFFVETMHLKPEYIIRFPKLVMYSLKKRTIPRCKVIKALEAKKLMKNLHIPSLINISDEKFTNGYILKHPTLSSSLWSLYLGKQNIDDIAVQQ